MVDNASWDGSFEYVQNNYHEVKVLVQPKNTGFSAVNNTAMQFVRTEYENA
jgi:GT2 family glycosyltransferase